MTEEERNLDLLVGELEHENRLVRARNERLEAEMVKLKAVIGKALRSLEALTLRPENSAIIKVLRETVEDGDRIHHAPAEDTEGGAV